MISDEDARYIVGQRAWEDFAKTTPPGFLQPEDRDRYIEAYLQTIEGVAGVLSVKLKSALEPLLVRMERAFYGEGPDGDCRICGITTSWSDEAGPIHPGCRAITKHGGDRWTE